MSDEDQDDIPPIPPPRSTSLFLTKELVEIPTSYTEATAGTNCREWRAAIESELSAHVSNKTWVIVDRPDTGTALSTKWVFNLKRDASGRVERYKARLVVRGFEQRYGIDYFDTYAPVAKIDSIRTLFALCAADSWIYEQFDVSTAFLNGTVSEQIFIEPPEGVQLRDNQCLQLKKALYGLKQAPACWNSCFDEALGKLGFRSTISDPCVYVSSSESTIILIYVDDGIVFSRDGNRAKEIVENLSKRFAIKRLSGDHYLGMRIEKTERGIRISQEQYILEILRKFNMVACNSVSSPLIHIDQLRVPEQTRPTAAPYREAIGCLQYVASRTRPDILFAANYLARFSKQPNEMHWHAVKRVIKYLKGTIDLGLEYAKSRDKDVLTPAIYSDADWANDLETRLSTTGVIVILAEGPIMFSSGKQASLAQSSTEAEYIAANEATKDIVWLRQFLGELKVKFNLPVLHIDNQSTIKQIENGDTKRRSKHVDIRYHYIRQEYKSKAFRMKAVPSEEQVADYLTKPINGPHLKSLINKSGLKAAMNSAYLVFMTMVCLISAINAIRFEQTDPMLWTETETYVELGVREFSVELTLLSACEVHLGTEWTSVYNINQLSYNVTKQKCMEKYQELVASAMDDLMVCLPIRRVAREPITIAIASSLTAAAVTGGGASIWSYLSSDSSYNRLNHMDALNVQRDADIEQLKTQLKNTQLAVTQGKDIRSDLVKSLGNHAVNIEYNKGAVIHLSKLSAQSAWDTANIYFTLQEDRQNIEGITDSCRKGKMNPNALFKLTKIPYLLGISEKDTYLEEIIKLSNQTVLIKFRARMPSPDTKVYRASPFPHWINTDSSPKFVDYNGPRYIVKNDSNECIRGIEPPTHFRVFDTCYDKDYVDQRLLKWDEVVDKDKLAILSQPKIYTSDTETTIYCLYHRIKIANRLRHCPPFPFKLPINVPFELPNMSHNVSYSTTRLKDRVVKISSLAMINRTDDDFEREIELLRKLKEKNDNSIDSMKFGIDKNTLTVPLEPYAYITVGGAMILLLCCVFSSRLRASYQKIPSNPNQHTENINIYAATSPPPAPPLPPPISEIPTFYQYHVKTQPLLPKNVWKQPTDSKYPDLAKSGLPFLNELLERTQDIYQQVSGTNASQLEEARKLYDTPPLRSAASLCERQA